MKTVPGVSRVPTKKPDILCAGHRPVCTRLSGNPVHALQHGTRAYRPKAERQFASGCFTRICGRPVLDRTYSAKIPRQTAATSRFIAYLVQSRLIIILHAAQECKRFFREIADFFIKFLAGSPRWRLHDFSAAETQCRRETGEIMQSQKSSLTGAFLPQNKQRTF